MSAILCHYLFGKRVQQESNGIISEQDAFLLGLQGPAIFQYGLLFSKQADRQITAFGKAAAGITLAEMQAYFAKFSHDDDPITASYSRGVLCYCCLEETTAPFISYGTEMLCRLNPGQTDDDCKNQIESALDIILLRYETGKLPTEIDLKTTVPASNAICRCVTALYQALLGDEIPREKAEALFWAGIKGIGKLNDKTTLKRQFLRRREKKRGTAGGFSNLFRNLSEDDDYDYANVCQNEWQWPMDTGPVRTETYFDLYEHAVTKMVASIWKPLNCVGGRGSKSD